MEMYGERKAFHFPQVGVIKYAPLLIWLLIGDVLQSDVKLVSWKFLTFAFCFFFLPQDCSVLELDDNRRHQANAAESIIS